MGGVAVALVLGVTLQIVFNDSAKRPLDAAHASASNPDRTGMILDDALDAAPFDPETECLAVLEAVQTMKGGHPQTSVAATQKPVDARLRWEGFLRQHWGHCHSVKPK